MNEGISFKALVLIVSMGVLVFAPGLGAQSFEPDSVAKTYRALWRNGRYEEALKHLNDEIEKSVDGVPMIWLLDRARLNWDLGRLPRAIAEMEWLHRRRATPQTTLLLAELYEYQGNREDAKHVLTEMQTRFRRATRYEDDTDSDLALHRIREMLGENPRVLFQSLLKLQPREKEVDHAKRFLAAGDLAYRKFDFQLGAEYYERTLAIEPDQLEAMAGLAACYWKSGDPRLSPQLEKVLAINPIHPLGKAIEAEMRLDAKQAEKALESINQVLVVNPNQLLFLGLKAAALFLMDHQDERAEVLRHALTVNPRASIVYRVTGRIASRHYRFEEAVAFQEKALELDPGDYQARALYAFDLLRLGKDQAGRDQLELSFEADRFNVQVYNMLELMDTLAKFRVVERGLFVLKMPERELEIWGDQALDLVEEAATHFQKKYRIKLEKPVMIQIFNDHDDFMVRSVGLPGSVGHLGICFGKLVTMDSPSARDKWAMNWRSVLWHEFVHVVTLQKTANRMPRWLSEGISVYEETLSDPSWGQRLDPRYKAVVDQDALPGLAEMESLFTQAKSPIHLMFGYFVSGELVRFYAERFGFDALVASLDLIRKGDAAHKALVQAAGVSGAELDAAFHETLNKRFAALKNLPDPEPDQHVINTLSSDRRPIAEDAPFTRAMLKGERAFGKEEWADAEKAFLEARNYFPEYFGEDSPVKRLIAIYARTERTDKLKEMLREALSLDPTDYQACRQLVELCRAEENWAELQQTAEKALAVDPFDRQMHRHLLEALEQQGDQGSLRLLDRLALLEPSRAIDHRLKRIDLLIRFEQPSQARREAVRLLENAPYSWEAQKRLLAIVEQDKKRGDGVENP